MMNAIRNLVNLYHECLAALMNDCPVENTLHNVNLLD